MNIHTTSKKLYMEILNNIGALKLDYKNTIDIKSYLISMINILDEYIENPQVTRIKYSEEIKESNDELFRIN